MLLIYGSSFYIHERGHIAYGFFDNKIHGLSSDFIISNWMELPVLSFIKVPQQTRMLEGKSSLNFALGGIILVVLSSLFISYLFYKSTKRKIYWLFPILFVYHEFIGNFLCGTDNPNSSPYTLCQHFSGWWIYPFLGVFTVLISILLYPKIFYFLQKKLVRLLSK